MTQQRFDISIPKQAVGTLPVVDYNERIVVINYAIEAKKALDFLKTQPIVGIDTESRPSFRKGRSHKVALVQIYAPGICFLFRLNLIGLLPEMIELFQSPAVKKIGLSLHDDFRNLSKSAPIEPKNIVELQTFVKNYHIVDSSLQRIFAIIFKQRISKSQRLSNWENTELTEHQKVYAAIDAWACYRIYIHLINNLFDPIKSEYVVEENYTDNEEDASTTSEVKQI